MATIPFSKARERMMADPEFRKEYDALEEEFALIEAIADVEASQNALDDSDNPPTDVTFWADADLVDPNPPKVPVRTRRHRDRHETACKDKRRNRSCCGICGSENVIRQGVAICEQCGAEEPYLMIEADWFQVWLDAAQQKDIWPHPPCGHEQNKRQMLTLPRDVYVLKCPDCGAVHGPRCPACGKPSWQAGKRGFCSQCGFRRD